MSHQDQDKAKNYRETDGDSSLEDQKPKDGVTETSRRGAKRRIIDETLLDEDEARRLEARRAYNRQCAAKARKRSKDLIAHLQRQVEELSKDKASLERTNEVMQAQLQLLEQQNRTLMMNQRGPSAMIPGVAGAGSLLGGLQGTQLMGGGPGGLPSVSLLESLTAQGRLASLQGDSSSQGGILGNPGLPRAPAPTTGASGNAGVDTANKLYG